MLLYYALKKNTKAKFNNKLIYLKYKTFYNLVKLNYKKNSNKY